ncbi:MAG: phenylacetate--CoA ligase family protein [Burkholderiales bacterium]
MPEVRSSVQGILWPGLPAPAGAAHLALQFQLEQSQWWPEPALRLWQFRQLDVLLRHAVATVPFYAERYRGLLSPEPVTPAGYAALPLLTRAEAQAAGEALVSRALPPAHGRHHPLQTSGSTGTPLRTLGTEITQFFWSALLLREHRWHRRHLPGKLAVIRTEVPSGTREGWGPATDPLFPTGPLASLKLDVDVERQLDWLQAEDPDYVLTFTTNAQALVRRARERGTRLPRLRELRTFGEALPEDLREEARAVWGVPVVDSYSSTEIGYVALQCPDHEHYHVQSENLLVEVLDAAGRVCAPGDIGQIVTTPLHSFATPLIRYASGDLAQVGAPCPCGRGLPVLTRILGRVRNMLRLPDGTRRWPSFPSKYWLPIAPIRQIQLVQHALDHVEVRAVCAQPFTAAQTAALQAAFAQTLRFPHRITISRVESIARNAGNKYEEFLCLVPD